MTDLELAQAAAACYEPVGAGWERVWLLGGVWMAYKAPILAFRGSVDAEDWLRDLRAIPAYQSDIGWVHAGFMAGMRDAFMEWRSAFPSTSPWLVGHSLGAAHASILAALLAASGAPLPQGLVVFGCPRPGFFKLRRTIRSGKFPVRVYSNRGDPVPDVPVPFWHLLPYRHPAKPIMLNAGAALGDSSPLAAHHMARYVEGISELPS